MIRQLRHTSLSGSLFREGEIVMIRQLRHMEWNIDGQAARLSMTWRTSLVRQLSLSLSFIPNLYNQKMAQMADRWIFMWNMEVKSVSSQAAYYIESWCCCWCHSTSWTLWEQNFFPQKSYMIFMQVYLLCQMTGINHTYCKEGRFSSINWHFTMLDTILLEWQ